MNTLRPVLIFILVGVITYLGLQIIEGPKTPIPIATPVLAHLTSSLLPTPAPKKAQKAQNRVVISKIAWMGTSVSSNDEWLQLYNPGPGVQDLNGWRLKAEDGKPDIPLYGSVKEGGYYLIERTSDNTVPGVAADLIASFGTGLSNSGENLELIGKNGQIIDQVDCQGGWYAGDNSSPQARTSMERVDLAGSGNDRANWRTSSGDRSQ